jgi:hypothetical protein
VEPIDNAPLLRNVQKQVQKFVAPDR